MILQKELEEIEGLIEKGDVVSEKISKSGTYWHTDHLLKVIIYTVIALKKSNPEEYKFTFSPARLGCFLFNFFPRGVGRAPRRVTAEEEITQETLRDQYEQVEELLSEWDGLHKNCHFKHPYFKTVNVKMSKKFLHIHTNHHLKIIREIL